MNGTRIAGLALCTLGIAAFGDVAVAQRTTFNPSVSVGATYSDDIGYTGVDDESDSATRIGLDLPVEREWRTGSLRFSYRPSYYKQQDVDELDRDEHRLGFRVQSQLSPRASLNFSTSFSRTQVQSQIDAEAEDIADGDLFVTERNERDLMQARLGYSRTASERWSWNVSGNWTDRQFEEIDDFSDPGSGETSVEDRTSYGGSFSFSRTLSRTSSLGLSYGYDTTDLDGGGDEDSNSLSLTYRREVGRNLQIGFSVGGFRSTGEASDGASDDDDERTGARGSFNVNRSYRAVDLGFSVSHRPTSGGDLPGTSTDTSVGLSLSGAGSSSETWDWRIAPRYGRRDPADSDEETREAYALNASVERRVQGLLGVRFEAGWVDQSDDDTETVDLGVSLVWYPLGRKALGGK